ncbi:hypothetical protein DNTS_018307 [Danionella cerebrum]|uniref:Fibronectin type-III domain-containing protein n=1 Tax=Danionella cerebrum TaxID=2873325 RepID=A0A553QER7_9TELE|nr:hypothetical protein DNTS_018307 [Danionella translucida]
MNNLQSSAQEEIREGQRAAEMGSHNPPPLPSLGLYLREEVDDQTFLLRSDSSPPRSSPDSYEIIPWQIQSRGSSPSVADLRAASEPRALLSEPEGIETRFMNFRKDQTEKAPVEPLEPNHGEEESSVELRMEGVRSSADCLVSLMASALMFLKQLSCIYCTLLCLGNLSSVNSKEDHRDAGGFQADEEQNEQQCGPNTSLSQIHNKSSGGFSRAAFSPCAGSCCESFIRVRGEDRCLLESLKQGFVLGQRWLEAWSLGGTGISAAPIETSALGRPLFPGMLYDCRKDSFIPGVTLWDKKALAQDVDTRQKQNTEVKFRASDSLTTKSNLLDVSASLKASFLGGLVEVGGSAKFLRDSKSSQHQTRVTMYHSESTRFEQLSMSHLGKITYPQVFDQKTATHVVTAVQYGAQVFMVFDRTVSGQEDKQEVEGELNVMINKIPLFSLEQNPTTYLEAVELYKKLPSLLKENAEKSVPIKVWLYPLHLLDTKAAQLERDISTSLVSNMVDITEELGEVERSFNDLSRDSLVNAFSDIKERLHSFQSSFRIYRSVFLKAVGRVLPSIRGGAMEEKSLEDILNTHRSSPFTATKLNQWLTEAKTELQLMGFNIKTLEGIKIEDSSSLKPIFLDLDTDAIVCFTFTSLRYEDSYLLTLEEFLKTDKFKDPHGGQNLIPAKSSGSKWFNDPDVILKMRENLSLFKSFSEANKEEKRIRFIISAISDPSSPGSSIYLYEKGKLTNKHFQPLSKPPALIYNTVQNTVSLKMQKSGTGDTVQYRVEMTQGKPGSLAKWFAINTTDQDFTVAGLDSEKLNFFRYRTVGRLGVSEASEPISITPPPFYPSIVGGEGGKIVNYMTPSITSINKITFFQSRIYTAYVVVGGMKVFFDSGHTFEVGDTSWGSLYDMIVNGKIVSATMWPNIDRSRFCSIEFVVLKSDGTTTKPGLQCARPGSPYKIDVKSGKSYGIKAYHDEDLLAMGFYFI